MSVRIFHIWQFNDKCLMPNYYLIFSHIYLIHCSSGPSGSSMLAPLSLDIKACIPPVTPPLDVFPELWLLDLFLLGADNGDELIGSGLE